MTTIANPAAVGIGLKGHHVRDVIAHDPALDFFEPVADAVWDLYRRTLRHLGPRPTLIERDQAIPPLAVLVTEAQRAHSALVDATAWPEAA